MSTSDKICWDNELFVIIYVYMMSKQYIASADYGRVTYMEMEFQWGEARKNNNYIITNINYFLNHDMPGPMDLLQHKITPQGRTTHYPVL